MRYRLERRDALLLVLLLAIASFRGLLWIASYPALKISDETSHFDHVQFRAEHQLRRPIRLPVEIDKVMPTTASTELKRTWTASQFYFRDSFLIAKRRVPEERELEERATKSADAVTSGQNTAMGYPGVFYALSSIPYKLFRKSSVLTRIFAIRATSLLWGLLLVACTYVVARWSVGHRPLAFVAALFTTLQPMAAQQMIAVNNDAGLVGLCALVFLLQLAIVRRLPEAPSIWLVLGLAATTALAIETKPQAYGMLPGSILLLTTLLVGKGGSRRALVTIAIGVLAYVVIRFATERLLGRVWAPDQIPRGASGPVALTGAPTPSIFGFIKFMVVVDPVFLDYLFTTGWGSFCWLDIYFWHRWFTDIWIATPLLWLGLGTAGAQRLLLPKVRWFWELRLVAFAAFTTVTGFAVVFFAEYYARVNFNADHQIQGRAFLFVLPSAAILGAVAVGSLVPARFRTLAAALAALSLVILACGALFTVVQYQYVG